MYFHLMTALLLNRQVEFELSRKLLFRIQPGLIPFDNQTYNVTGLQEETLISCEPVRKVDSPDPAVSVYLNLDFS